MKEQGEKQIMLIPKNLIFDMDGTLYELDGENGTFKNSSLSLSVIGNSIRFVMEREGCTLEAATEFIKEAQKDKIGISNVLSKKYGITRSDVFDNTWNIEPALIIKKFETSVQIINRLQESGKKMFLLTAAPRIWMENVITHLNLSDRFERKINGEMFGEKSEIFKILSEEFGVFNIMSIGDQFDTDIKPALEVGMKALQVSVPEDLKKLI